MKETGYGSQTLLVWVPAHPLKSCIMYKPLNFPECSFLFWMEKIIYWHQGVGLTPPNPPRNGCFTFSLASPRPLPEFRECAFGWFWVGGHMPSESQEALWVSVPADGGLAGEFQPFFPSCPILYPEGHLLTGTQPGCLNQLGPSSPCCFPGWLLFWVSAQQSLPEGDLPWPPGDSGPASLPLSMSQHWLLASQSVISLCAVCLLLACLSPHRR